MLAKAILPLVLQNARGIGDLESHLCYRVNIFEALHFTLYLEPHTGHYSSNLHTETPFTLAQLFTCPSHVNIANSQKRSCDATIHDTQSFTRISHQDFFLSDIIVTLITAALENANDVIYSNVLNVTYEGSCNAAFLAYCENGYQVMLISKTSGYSHRSP